MSIEKTTQYEIKIYKKSTWSQPVKARLLKSKTPTGIKGKTSSYGDADELYKEEYEIVDSTEDKKEEFLLLNLVVDKLDLSRVTKALLGEDND